MRTRSARLMMIQQSQKLKDYNNYPIIKHQVQVDDSDEDDDKPHFFKIIVSPLDQKTHLRIPREFVKKHGMHLADDIWLNVPKSKQTWKVELEKDSNDNLFLGKGWQAFMEFYNLDYGYLLVFRLDVGAQTHFRVLIFNKTAAEIDYSVEGSSEAKRRTNSARLSVDNEISEDDNDVIVVGEDSPRSPKLNKTTESVINLDDDTSDSDDVKSSGYKGTGYVISNDMKKKLLRKLDKFESSYPHFKVIMYPSYVQNGYRMSVSFSHAAEHFPIKSKEIVLKGPNGKRYHASFLIGGKRATIYSAGWKNFVLDNQVKAGDACVFELREPPSHSYEVTVLRR